MNNNIKNKFKGLVSYLINDPVGETSMVIGSYGVLNYSLLFFPLTAFGLVHTKRMFKRRKDISTLIQNNGWQGSQLERQATRSWCSRQVIRAYAWSRGEYNKFRGFWRSLGKE